MVMWQGRGVEYTRVTDRISFHIIPRLAPRLPERPSHVGTHFSHCRAKSGAHYSTFLRTLNMKSSNGSENAEIPVYTMRVDDVLVCDKRRRAKQFVCPVQIGY